MPLIGLEASVHHELGNAAIDRVEVVHAGRWPSRTPPQPGRATEPSGSQRRAAWARQRVPRGVTRMFDAYETLLSELLTARAKTFQVLYLAKLQLW